MSLPWSESKQKLSDAAERRLVRVVKSQLKTTKKQICNEIKSCWKMGISLHSRVCFASVWTERLLHKKEAVSPDVAPPLTFAADHMDEEKPSGGKQTLSCLATMSTNMFRGEKAWPFTPRTPYLLSSMVLVVLCCGAVFLPVDLLQVNRMMKDEDNLQILQKKIKSPARRLALECTWFFQRYNDP